MRPKLLAVFLFVVLAPLGALGWLGIRTAQNEREIVAHRFEALLAGELDDAAGIVRRLMEERERDLSRILSEEDLGTARLREIVRSERIVRQVFVLGADGKLEHPPLDAPRNASEEELLTRTSHIWKSREPFARGADGAAKGRDRGWYSWYWGAGLNLIYWMEDEEGRILGAELDRVGLLADVVGELPVTSGGDPPRPEGRIRLVDADGEAVYGWGAREPGEGETPLVSRALAPPLGAWRLQYFPAGGETAGVFGKSVLLGTLAALGALALAVAGLAVYFFRESGREVLEARQRVTFVNQVSHELKTPLTNIRMYAELLEDRIAEDDEKAGGYLGVIVSESQRLSRLIGNVLSFARKQRRKLSVRPAAGRVDGVVEAVVSQFRPSLEAAGFELRLDLNAPELAQVDRDAVGQILGNLIGNVEKYASSGKWLGVSTRRRGDVVEIAVADRGSGVPRGSRRRIFEPFFRSSSKVSDGATGTGIGLSIARDLARLHGGDLVLAPSDRGARFLVSIRAPVQEGGDPR